MKKIFYLLFLISFTSWGKEHLGNGFVLTPIIGFEQIKQLAPTVTSQTRIIYGAKLLFPLPISTIELEYTHGQNTVTDLSTQTSYKFIDDKLKLGLIGYANLGPFITTHLRGGAQLSTSKDTKTTATNVSTQDTISKVNPYLGTGLSLHFYQYLSINGSLTCIYAPTKTPGMSDYQLEPSIGIGISI